MEKGLASKNGMPIEIMGLMSGTMDPDNERGLIITDVFPLPVEGTETTVLSESDEVLGYMTRLADMIEVRAPATTRSRDSGVTRALPVP